MGSDKWGYGVPLRVPLKGSIGFLGFRGSFKSCYNPYSGAYNPTSNYS